MSKSKGHTYQTGICDWSAKKALLRAFYDVLSDKALVQAVVEAWVKEDHDLLDVVEDHYSRFVKWHKSMPMGSKSQKFWLQIIDDQNPKAGRTQLWSSSITEFIDFFEDHSAIKEAVLELLADSRASLDSETKTKLQNRFKLEDELEVNVPLDAGAMHQEYNLRGHLPMTFEGPQTGIHNGCVQSTQFYQVPEAAKAWAAMVDSENYRMYLECLLSLKELVKSKHWNAAVRSGTYNAAVTLGGGASPEKDWVIATSLFAALKEPKSKLTYVLNDISTFMIQHSARFLERRLAKEQLCEQIKIVYDWSDFLQLDLLFRRPDCQAIVWAILGGTIGNVSELNFFRSINGPSKPGDLLVVGVDTIDNESVERFEERMITEYRSRELDALLLTPMSDTVGLDGEEPVVKVTVQAYVDAASFNRSNVPNSRTAVFSSPLPGKPDLTILAYSTRYVLEDFLAYARQFGWECLGTTPAPSESTFRQLLLRRAT